MATCTAIAPGMIILSGEHAVVYGAPAIVTAVDMHARAAASPLDAPILEVSSPSESYACTWTLDEARSQLAAVRRRHADFLEDARPIDEVLPQVCDLLPLAAAVILDRADNLAGGVSVTLSMDMPSGSGMGSSAAGALAVQGAVAAVCGLRRSRDESLADAMTCERWIHGRPSGVDPYVCLRGGTVRFVGGEADFVALADRALTLVHTGRPASATGACVEHVRRANHPAITWDAFAATAGAIETAITDGNQQQLLAAVRSNHRLLCRIGVVPQSVQDFIAEIEAAGGAAKICGAGSVTGETAGMVWCIGSNDVARIATDRGYGLHRVEGGVQGARVIDPS